MPSWIRYPGRMWDRLNKALAANADTAVPNPDRGNDDCPVPPGNRLASEILQELIERTWGAIDPAPERIQAILTQLTAGRTYQFELHFIRSELLNAMIIPGRRIYLSSALETWPDEAIAFVLGHEIAHYDFGHIQQYAKWLQRQHAMEIAAIAFDCLHRFFVQADWERAADARSVDLCHAAHINLTEAMKAFQLIEPSQKAAEESFLKLTAKWPPQLGKLREWLDEKSRGYPTVAERRTLAEAQVCILNVI